MPTFGTAASSSSGNVKRGLVIPSGSLDVWKAARALHATQRTEVVIFGDSTTYGSAALPGPAFYSWVAKLRGLSVAAGYTDGGRGVVGSDPAGTDGAALSGEGLNQVQAQSGFAGGNVFISATGGHVVSSQTPGEWITWQGYGTAIRINYGYATNVPTGTFTYSVDGGTAVTVDAHTGASGESARSVYISGLTNGLHTLTVTNTGDATNKWVSHTVDFLKSTGIVYHKAAGVGAQIGGWFDTLNPSLLNYQAALSLGLDLTATSVNTFGWGLPPGPKPQTRNVSLAIMQLGTNNSPTDPAQLDGQVKAIEAGTEIFIRMCRAAGCDPVVCIPPFQAANGAHVNAGPLKRAFSSVALAHGVVLVDFDEILGSASTWPAKGYGNGAAGNPHLPQTAYDAEATFLWNNVLSI